MKSVPSRPSLFPPFGDSHKIPAPRVPGCTYDEISAWQLGSLCTALGLQATAKENLELQRMLFEPWGQEQVPASPAHASSIGDDHSPYEYSLAFSKQGVELRILFEAQAKEPTPRALQAAALKTNQRLEQHFGLDLTRFNAVADLFLPEDPAPPFSLWHAVCLNAGKAPEFKIYLNPQARGKDNARALTIEAMERLGLAESARQMFPAVARRGSELDEVRYFSLDLSAKREARVKVYFAHHGATAKDLERAFRFAPSHIAGDVEAYLQVMAGHHGPFRQKPITSCFAFVAGREAPSAVTMHYPIAHYEYDDERAAARVSKYLQTHNSGLATYQGVLAALARRPLDDGAGMQSYASFRREGKDLRFTVYLSPELFRGATQGSGTRIAS